MPFAHSWQTDRYAGNVRVCKIWEAYFINHAHGTKKQAFGIIRLL